MEKIGVYSNRGNIGSRVFLKKIIVASLLSLLLLQPVLNCSSLQNKPYHVLVQEVQDYLLALQQNDGSLNIETRLYPVIASFLSEMRENFKSGTSSDALKALKNYIVNNYCEDGKWKKGVSIETMIYLANALVSTITSQEASEIESLVNDAASKILNYFEKPGNEEFFFQKSDLVFEATHLFSHYLRLKSVTKASEALVTVLGDILKRQSNNGNWINTEGNEDTIYTTSKMLQCLIEINEAMPAEKNIKAMERATDWLILNRNRNGGWGAANSYTGLVMDALINSHLGYGLVNLSSLAKIADDLEKLRNPSGGWSLGPTFHKSTAILAKAYLIIFNESLNLKYYVNSYTGISFLVNEWYLNRWEEKDQIRSVSEIGSILLFYSNYLLKTLNSLYFETEEVTSEVSSKISFLKEKTDLELSLYIKKFNMSNGLKKESRDAALRNDWNLSVRRIYEAYNQLTSLNSELSESINETRKKAANDYQEIETSINALNLSSKERSELNTLLNQLYEALTQENYKLFNKLKEEILENIRSITKKGLTSEQLTFLKKIQEINNSLIKLREEAIYAEKRGMSVQKVLNLTCEVNKTIKDALSYIYLNETKKASLLIKNSTSELVNANYTLKLSEETFNSIQTAKNKLLNISSQLVQLKIRGYETKEIESLKNDSLILLSLAEEKYRSEDFNGSKLLLTRVDSKINEIQDKINNLSTAQPLLNTFLLYIILIPAAAAVLAITVLLLKKKQVSVLKKEEETEELKVDLEFPTSLRTKLPLEEKEKFYRREIPEALMLPFLEEINLSEERRKVKEMLQVISKIAKEVNVEAIKDSISTLEDNLEKITSEQKRLSSLLSKAPPEEKKIYSTRIRELDEKARRITQVLILKRIQLEIGERTRDIISNVKSLLYK